MRILRTYLGRHSGVRRGQLTERETAMLVVAAGRRAGYTVRTECIVFGRKRSGAPGRGEIDVGWYNCDDDTIRVAWEIDGQDASEEHFLGYEGKDTLGNKAKLLASEAPLKVQVLYSLKNNLRKKRDSKLDCIRHWLGSNVTVVTDEELIRRGGIERWVTAARLVRVSNTPRGKLVS